MNKTIYVYTTKNCSFCKNIKNDLIKNNIEFVERDKDDFKKEWNYIVSLTKMPVFPTINIDSECLIPNRDFSNPNQMIDMINQLLTNKWNKQDKILEMLKSMHYGIGLHLNKNKNE